MERKTKHRLLGLIVLIALIVLLFPLLTRHDVVSEPTMVKAPPFPDQSVQVPVNSDDVSPDITSSDNPPAHSPTVPVKTPGQSVKPATLNDNDANQQPDDTIPTNSVVMQPLTSTPTIEPSENTDNHAVNETEKMASNKPSENAAANEKENENTNLSNKEDDDEDLSTKSGVPSVKEINDSRKIKYMPQVNNNMQHSSSPATSIQQNNAKFVPHILAFVPTAFSPKETDPNGLIKLKNAAWVIQLGSFKNKTNALRLVNRLRASGYPAFIQEISMGFGNNTRVFVGPEAQQTHARVLANQLANHLHLQGIVVSYKPLAL